MFANLFNTTLLVLLFSTTGLSQSDNAKYDFKVIYEKQRQNGKLVAQSDTLYLTFLYSFKSDIVTIHTNKKIFSSDTLNAQNLYGIGGKLLIPKKEIKGKVEIFFNGRFLSKFKINKKYTAVHLELDSDKHSFIWRYLRYRFSYL